MPDSEQRPLRIPLDQRQQKTAFARIQPALL